jgi:hypothetical protein
MHGTGRRAARAWWVGPGLVLLLSACGEDFAPPSELGEAPQVLAVRATPPDVAPGGTTVFDALVHWPGVDPVLFYLVCIPDVGDSLTSCLTGQFGDATDLPLCVSDPSARLCLAGMGVSASYTVPEDAFPDDGQTHTFFLNVLATESLEGIASCASTLSGGEPTESCMLSVKRVVFSRDATHNANPVVERFLVDAVELEPDATAVVPVGELGIERLDVELGVTVEASSVDETVTTEGEPTSVDLVVSWFTTCGAIDPYRSFLRCEPGTDGGLPACSPSTVSWEPGMSGPCIVHAVIRDSLGGTAFGSQAFLIE